MDLQIIDTGYGLERFCWAAAGTPTIYEAIYPESVNWLKGLSGFEKILSSSGIDANMDSLLGELSRLAGILNIDVGTDVEELYVNLSRRLSESGISVSVDELKRVTEPLSSIYAIPDHMHAICNMLGDGLVPSNSKAGYLSRMLARRVCRMRDSLSINASLSELAAHHMDNNMEISPFPQSRSGILTILELEESRYHEMLRKGEAAVRTALKGVSKESLEIDDQTLFRLSEERGLNPEMVVSIAAGLGWKNLSVRVGFAADMAARNAIMTKAAAKARKQAEIFDLGGLDQTSADYYNDTSSTKFSAEILRCIEISQEQLHALSLTGEVEGSPSHAIILDRTLFYPEGLSLIHI